MATNPHNSQSLSYRDSGVNINADESSFSGAGDLILNGDVVGGDTTGGRAQQSFADSILQGSLGTFLTDFFQNGGSGDDC